MEVPTIITQSTEHHPMIATTSPQTQDDFTADEVLPLINALNQRRYLKKTNRPPGKKCPACNCTNHELHKLIRTLHTGDPTTCFALGPNHNQDKSMRHHLSQYMLKHPPTGKPVPTLPTKHARPPQKPALPKVNTTQMTSITASDGQQQADYYEEPDTSGYDDIYNDTIMDSHQETSPHAQDAPMCNSIHAFSSENQEFIESFEQFNMAQE